MGSLPPDDAETSHKAPDSTDSTSYNGVSYTIIREGLAEILSPQAKEESDNPKPQTVFYNPIQQFNRDLSVLAVRAFADDLAAIRRAHPVKGGSAGRRSRKRKRGNEDGSPSTRDGVVELEGKAGQEQNNGDAAPPRASPPFRILDALSATGLRALRYAKEVPLTTAVTANDLSSQATASIQLNIAHNQLEGKVTALTGDARAHMYTAASPIANRAQRLYEVIDLDPYGTAASFLDSAVRAVVDGGLLCITCTDAGVFASLGYLEKTYSQYGGLPLKGPHAHEVALRLILHAIATSGAPYGIAIEPLLSLSIDFYVRVFVRVRHSPLDVKFLASKTMVVYSCDDGCGAWNTQFLAQSKKKTASNGDKIYKYSLAQAPSTGPFCPHCDFKTHLSGPMWGGPIHNPQFIQHILEILPSLDRKTYATIPRIEGMLSLALHESPSVSQTSSGSDAQTGTDEHALSSDNIPPIPRPDPSLRCNHPFFIVPSSLAKIIHCVSPSDAAIRGALAHLGYWTSRSHTKPGSICTDAPWSVVWEIMREWVRQKSPIKDDAIKRGTPGWGILSRDRSKGAVNEEKSLLRDGLRRCDNLQELELQLQASLLRVKKARRVDVGDDDGEETGEVDSAEKPMLEGPTHKLRIVFDEVLGQKVKEGRKMVRYQMNPRPEWGPMNRAKGM